MLQNLKNYILVLLSTSMLLAGCSGGNDEPSGSEINPNDNSLKSLSFLKESNAGLPQNYTCAQDNQTLYVTLPDGIDLTKLVPTFVIAEGATLSVNNAQVENGKTSVDFSNTTKLVIKSQSGLTRTYMVLAKNGDPKIDQMVYSYMIKHDVPGVSLAISKDESLVYKAAYGFADVSKEERVTSDYMFRLASMSKQHTSIAIMKLFEEGKLSLNDCVFGKDGILGEMLGDNIKDSRARHITVQQLLEHTSGYSVDNIFGGLSRYSGMTLKDRMVYLLENESLAYTPGTTHKYNNFGFSALGLVVEAVSGKDFETYLKEDIYSHSKESITNIRGGKNDAGNRFANEVVYYAQGSKDAYGNNVEVGIAAGGIIASAPDLMKLMNMVDYGTNVPDLLKEETLDIMYKASEANNRYALGWRVNYPYITSWASYHGGTLAGVCPIWARGHNNVNGVILCNSRSYDMDIDDDLWYMLEDIRTMF
ncbi:MAG: beta-lactamase family protein [Bacteroidales bacterium]|nr:beta-lactamase family protein [Bacteroidales bacterium]